jgi:hypothetical protein
MTSIDVPRNQNQRAGQINRVQGRIVNANTGIYTVPAGKRARITDIRGVLNSVGVDPTYAIAFKRGVVFTAITNFQIIDIEQFASAITLESGDILTNIGDAGSTNGTFDLSATIEEFSS